MQETRAINAGVMILLKERQDKIRVIEILQQHRERKASLRKKQRHSS